MRKVDIDFLRNAAVVILLLFMNFNPRHKRVKYLLSKFCDIGVFLNVSSMKKNQSSRHKKPFVILEAEQIEGFFGKKE